MSIFSGKCDLYDHICGCGGWYDSDGNLINDGDGSSKVYFHDEYRDFLVFKKRTGGVIHQHKKVEVTEFNQQFVKDHCEHFDFIKHVNQVQDKRTTSGYREEITYTYTYWYDEYKNLKELNKCGVYITLDIHFDTLLDLIPYYPYLVGFSTSKKNEDGTTSEYVVISKDSIIITERNTLLRAGSISMWEFYAKALQDHYREIVLRYFNPEGKECVEELTFDDNGRAFISKPIDENFNVEWVFDDGAKPHWSSPKVVNNEDGEIEMSKNDFNIFLGHTMKVKYVEKRNYPLWLK